MYRSPNRGGIRPKLSTMPAQRSQARVHLGIYKMVIEKERLQKELDTLEIRRGQIQSRLTVLEEKIESQLSQAEKMNQESAKETQENDPKYSTFKLEY